MSLNLPYKNSPHFIERLWDAACILSVLGIWPRYIEPNVLTCRNVLIPLEMLPRELSGMTLVHISDLHFSSYSSKRFLERASERIRKLAPDCIVLTGDLLTYAELEDRTLAEEFLLSLSAPLGCFASLGNHDYSSYVSLARDGTFCLMQDKIPTVLQGFWRLISSKKMAENPEVQEPLAIHEAIQPLLAKTGWTLLHNETCQIGTTTHHINLTGLGDLMCGNFRPMEAFRNCDPRVASLVLSHNPDTFALLNAWPGDLILSGHTHGGQINLPFIWKRITPTRDKTLKSGLVARSKRFLYINRGLGAPFPFRLFAPPEITKITLVSSELARIQMPLFEFEPVKKPRFATYKSSSRTSL
jgi:hypothetical protein